MNSMDYSANVEPDEIQCYSCIFEIRNGHESGMPGCDRRFIKTGIPTVSCAGPCAVRVSCCDTVIYVA